jgi:hypothetical protein
MLFVELRTSRAFFTLGDCGLFHCDDFWIKTVNPTFVTRYDPRDKFGSSLAFSHSSRHVYAPLLLMICEESGNKLRGNAAHV